MYQVSKNDDGKEKRKGCKVSLLVAEREKPRLLRPKVKRGLLIINKFLGRGKRKGKGN